ncbi:hypothetical protein [Megamonas hypermegale]|uniref:hypothetical protein n=1 Tax=Megamonas hypermegale TaxID=158847 RepID=UPI0026E9F578|nr:hypothetical protein [Megamonas hypermegale]
MLKQLIIKGIDGGNNTAKIKKPPAGENLPAVAIQNFICMRFITGTAILKNRFCLRFIKFTLFWLFMLRD